MTCSIKNHEGIALGNCGNERDCVSDRHHWLEIKSRPSPSGRPGKLSADEQKELEKFQMDYFLGGEE